MRRRERLFRKSVHAELSQEGVDLQAAVLSKQLAFSLVRPSYDFKKKRDSRNIHMCGVFLTFHLSLEGLGPK